MRTLSIISLAVCASLQAAPSPGPVRPVRPVLFEPGPETGQYLAHASRGSLRLTAAGIEFAARDQRVIRLALAGAKGAQPIGDELLPSTTSYFLGNDPKGWRTRVANYGKVRYNGIYQGIDLVFRGAEKSFEYDFLIAPHADPSRIRMRFDGASTLSVNAEGDLLVDGWFTQRRPRIYQELAQGTREIAGRFRIHRDHTVSFETGAYDRSRPLVIDPVITYTSYLGGTAFDSGNAITTDKDGNVFVGGSTVANNFPGTTTFGQRPAIRQAGFVTKFAPIVGGGTQLVFTIFLGDNTSIGNAEVNALATDSGGNLIAAGDTSDTFFPTKNAVQSQLSGGKDCLETGGDSTQQATQILCSDGFLSKFGPDGATLLFSTYYGGKLENEFNAVAVDSADNIYVAGKAFGPTDLAGTVNAVQPHPTNTANIHMASFDPTGKVLYATYLGGTGGQYATTIAVEKPGVVWIGGPSGSSDMPTTANGYITKYAGLIENAYFARIDTTKSGKAGLTYGSFFSGPSGNSNINHLFLDPTGQVVFCGSAFSVLPTTPTAMQANGFGAPQADVSASLVDADAFIARINPALTGASQLTYGSYISGTDLEAATGCGLDPQGNFVVSGYTLSQDPFLTPGTPLPLKPIGSNYNIFFIRIDPTQAGGRLESLLYGGEGFDVARAMAIDNKGFAYVTGRTLSKVFPVIGNAIQKTYGGDDNTLLSGACCGDTFVMQLDLNRMQAGVAGLALDGGDFQAGPANSVLPNPLSVHLVDVNGNQLALPGYAVSFAANNGITLVSGAEGVTDGTGVTGVRVKLGSANGTVTATIVGTAVTYVFHVIVGSGTGTPGCTYTLSPTSLQPTAAGGDSSINIQTGAGCAWSVTGLPSWITVSGAASGNGPATVTLVVAANTGAARSGTVSISGSSVTVNQAAPGCTYSLSAGGQAFPASGGNGSITVTAQTGCAWSVSGTPTWVTLKSGAAGSGSGTLTYQVGANSGADRIAAIQIGNLTFSIEQASATLAGAAVAGSMAQIASAGGWKMTITLINTGTSVAQIRLNFFDKDGNPLQLPLTFPQTGTTQQNAGVPDFKRTALAATPSPGPLLASTLDRSLGGGASLIIETTGPDAQTTLVGWAQLLSTGSVGGFATFTINASHQEAVVPLEIRNAASYRLAFDNTGGLLTGLAIANLATQTATIPLIIRDDTGTQIGNPLLTLQAHAHTSFMLTEMYAITGGKRGTVEFDTPAGGQISVLGLRAHAPALTTLPLLANVSSGGGSLAHVASGGGWQTTFTFVNTGTSAAQITLTFKDDHGNLLSLPLAFPQTSTSTTASSVTKTLAPNASLVIQTQGSSAQAVATGSADLTTNGNVDGFAIFRDGTTGQEAVVPLETRAGGNFILAFDNTGGLSTGIAIANINGQAAAVPVVLRDDTGALLASPTLNLPAANHTSFLLGPTYAATAGKRGTMEFDTPAGGKISGLGLRATPDGTLTTIPVLKK